MAFRANQPLPFSCIAESETPAADRARRHRDMAARTVGNLAARERLAHLPLFGRVELRLLVGMLRFVGHGIESTILPNCAPSFRRSKALRPSAIGKTLSTGGASRPAENSATIASNSASFPMVEPISDH